MKAVVCIKNGDASIPLTNPDCPLVIDSNQARTSKLKAKHIRVKVHACSLNFPDSLQIQGTYQTKLPLPFIPGSEASGVIVESSSPSFQVGDRVVAVVSGGALAEQLVVHESSVFKVPARVTLEDAACVPITFGTAELALRSRANIGPRSTVLILGAAGGVGVAACQISLMLGARIIAVVSGREKGEFVKSLGVASGDVIDLSGLPPGSSLGKEFKRISGSGGRGADVIFDPVGGPLFPEALKTAAWGCQYLIIGFAAGTVPQIPANYLLVKNVTVHGVFWGSYLGNDPSRLRQGIDHMLQAIEEGKLKPRISHSLPMERIDEAFRIIKDRKVMGKIIIKINALLNSKL